MTRSTMAFAALLAAVTMPSLAVASSVARYVPIHRQASYHPHVDAVRFPHEHVVRSHTSRNSTGPAYRSPDFSTFQFREDLPLNFNPKAITPGDWHLRSCDHPEANICIDSRGYIVPTETP